MTRTLILLRHVKSDWQSGAADDHDRPLNDRGRRAAAIMGAYLQQSGLVPDAVVTSSAVRAVQTAELVLHHAGLDIAPRTEPSLYLAKPAQILDVMHRLPAKARCAMLVGHNPGFQDLAVALTAGSEKTIADAVRAHFPTGAMAICETEETWKNAANTTMSVTRYTYPKDLV